MSEGIFKQVFERKERKPIMSDDDKVVFEALVAYRDNLIRGEYNREAKFKLRVLNERLYEMTKHF